MSITLKRWADKKPSEQIFKIEKLVRQHQYYRCFRVSSQKGETMLLWKLHGAANPFISLLDLFQMHVIPTTSLITKWLVAFIARAWRTYAEMGRNIKQFEIQFFNCYLRQQKKQTGLENQQISKIIKQIQGIKHEQLDQFVKTYDLSATENKLIVPECSFYEEQMNEVLSELPVIPMSERMDRLVKICSELNSINWKSQIFHDQSSVFILTACPFDTKNNYDVLTLQEVIEINQKNEVLIIADNAIDEITLNLLNKLNQFEMATPGSNLWAYPLDFATIFVETNINADGKMLMKQDCHLDFLQLFVRVLGLTHKVCTIENLLTFRSKHKPYCTSFEFAKTLKQKFEIVNQTERLQIQICVKWLLITDYLYVSELKRKGKSLIERQTDKVKLLQALITNQPKNTLHSSTRTVLNLINYTHYKVAEQTQKIRLLTLNNISREVEQDKEGQKLGLFEPNRYALIKNCVELRSKLFFEKHHLKDFFCEQNRYIKSLDSHGKYIVLYLLSHYALMATEISFLELWRGEPVHFKDDNDTITPELAKFVGIVPKLQPLVDVIDINATKWGANIKEQMKKILIFCQTLKGLSYGASYAGLTLQNRALKVQQLTTAITAIKQKLECLFGILRNDFEVEVDTHQKLTSKTGIKYYLDGRKNLSLKQLFINLNIYNYSELYCEAKLIMSYESPTNQETKQHIKEHFDKLEDQLNEFTSKGSASFQEIFTSLIEKQIKM